MSPVLHRQPPLASSEAAGARRRPAARGVTLAVGAANAGRDWNWRPWSNDTYAALQLHSQGLVLQTKAFLCPLILQQTTYWTKSHVSVFSKFVFTLLLFILKAKLKVWYLEFKILPLKSCNRRKLWYCSVSIFLQFGFLQVQYIYIIAWNIA